MITGVSSEPTTDSIELDSANLFPPDLEALSEKHYGDCNVRSYFVKIGLAQEQFRDGKLNEKNQELRQERANLADITNFLSLFDENPGAKEVSLVGHNELTERLFRLLPDKRLKQAKLTRIEADLLKHALTRHSDQQITPNIQELTNDMTHIIEDLDKILPLLKELLKSYDDLINRINNKPK